MRYSKGFRNGVLRKVLPPESRSVSSVAREVGISPVTLQSWLNRVREGTLDVDHEGFEPTPEQRAAAEKFRILLESKTKDTESLGEWLRQHGLHSEHLTLWEQELEGLVTDKQQDLKKENAELKKAVRRLERENQRQQAAMAEALALITLQKKTAKLFESDAED
jgi:transposase